MFFKRKLKSNIGDIKNQKINKPPVGSANLNDFDYEAIRFNEFLTDDSEHQKKQSINDNESPYYDDNDVLNAPFGKHIIKDNQTVKHIESTITANLQDVNLHDNQPAYTNKILHKQTQAPLQPYNPVSQCVTNTNVMSNNTKNYLQNQKTKVLLTEDLDTMIQNFNQVTTRAATILNDPNEVTKPLSPTSEYNVSFIEESMASKQLPNTTAKLNTTDVKKSWKDMALNHNLNTQPIQLPKNKTKALFDRSDSIKSVDNSIDLKTLTPIKKIKVLLRIRKTDKREI